MFGQGFPAPCPWQEEQLVDVPLPQAGVVLL
jgi:hypothetical protein